MGTDYISPEGVLSRLSTADKTATLLKSPFNNRQTGAIGRQKQSTDLPGSHAIGRHIRGWSAMKLKIVGIAVILTAAVSSSASADLVTNGNFSGCSGHTCTGWTFTRAASGTVFFYSAGSAFFGAEDTSDDEISQTLSTVPGQLYTVSFSLVVGDPRTNQNFSVDFGPTTIFSELNMGSASQTTFSFNVSATSLSTSLEFFGRNDPSSNILTAVSVVPGTTPLPAALPLFATGLGALGLLGWRRKRKTQAVA